MCLGGGAVAGNEGEGLPGKPVPDPRVGTAFDVEALVFRFRGGLPRKFDASAVSRAVNPVSSTGSGDMARFAVMVTFRGVVVVL